MPYQNPKPPGEKCGLVVVEGSNRYDFATARYLFAAEAAPTLFHPLTTSMSCRSGFSRDSRA